jgi:hypothetical protein
MFSRWHSLLRPEIISILVLGAYALPGMVWCWPTSYDRLESYQPMQALKFFATMGHAFHKYGPMSNFVLAPVYALQLAIWRLTGAFSKPAQSFPFGFTHPLEQMNWMIAEGRVVFMALCLWSVYVLVKRLGRCSGSRALTCAVALLLISSNYCYGAIVASTRTDALMMAFGGLFMAVYLDAVLDGLTIRRGVLMALGSVCAVSSKELIYAMILLPMAYLVVRVLRGKDPLLAAGKPLIGWMLTTAGVAVVGYALLDVVYAPATWLQRIHYWTTGEGLDPAIWANYSAWTNLKMGSLCVLDHLGVGGAVLTAIALVALLISRPRHSLALTMPVLSFLVFGVARIHYTEIRYFLPLALSLPPLVLLGLEQVRLSPAGNWRKRVAVGLVALCVGSNLVWGLWSFYMIDSIREVVMRRDILSSPRDRTYFIFNVVPQYPGMYGLSEHGYKVDVRGFQEIVDQNGPWPDTIYIARGGEDFIRDALRPEWDVPKRVEFLKGLGFYAPGWKGFESEGYCRKRVIEPYTPAWWPFRWMYGVREQTKIETVYVYTRPCP